MRGLTQLDYKGRHEVIFNIPDFPTCSNNSPVDLWKNWQLIISRIVKAKNTQKV
jgi:hypothetical protein